MNPKSLNREKEIYQTHFISTGSFVKNHHQQCNFLLSLHILNQTPDIIGSSNPIHQTQNQKTLTTLQIKLIKLVR